MLQVQAIISIHWQAATDTAAVAAVTAHYTRVKLTLINTCVPLVLHWDMENG